MMKHPVYDIMYWNLEIFVDFTKFFGHIITKQLHLFPFIAISNKLDLLYNSLALFNFVFEHHDDGN